jgi:hypothetical protein
MIKNTDGPAPVPAPLAVWLQERSFDVCPWYRAPRTAQKIIGKDAWRFANVVLTRAPIGTEELRYYVAICPGDAPGKVQGQAVGYWLEVRRLSYPQAAV